MVGDIGVVVSNSFADALKVCCNSYRSKLVLVCWSWRVELSLLIAFAYPTAVPPGGRDWFFTVGTLLLAFLSRLIWQFRTNAAFGSIRCFWHE